MAGLRERNKHRTMAEIQNLALDMFGSDGFDAVTVEDIAATSGVSPSTVYRYFGTKERIVTWDETDQALTADLVKNLKASPPIRAFHEAVATRYSDEAANKPLRRRVQFIYANPQVHAAAIEQGLRDQADLATGFAQLSGRRKPSIEDRARAGVCMAALDAAIEEWQAPSNRKPLSSLIAAAFAVVDP